MPRITVTRGAVGSAEPTRSNAHGNDGNQADEVEEARAGGDVMRMRPMRRGRRGRARRQQTNDSGPSHLCAFAIQYRPHRRLC